MGTPPDPPQLDESFDWHGSFHQQVWDVHWSRATQTAMDIAHVPFVHSKTIGLAFSRALGLNSKGGNELRLETKITEVGSFPAGGFQMDWSFVDPSKTFQPKQERITFLPPNCVRIDLPGTQGSHQSYLYIWALPISEKRSRILAVSKRNFGRWSLKQRLIDGLNPFILKEDLANLESCWPSEVEGFGMEPSMPADASTVAFAKYYRKAFKNTHAETAQIK